MANARIGQERGESSLARVVGRGYWREEDARVVIAALTRSGSNVRDFAQRHGLDPKRLGRWKRRLERRDGDALGGPLTFFPIQVRDEARALDASPARPAMELVVGRYVIRLGGGFEPSVLGQLIDVLEQRGG